MMAQLPPEARAAGVITYSSGNHGQAVALVARSFGIPAVVVMPETAPQVKVDGVRHFGAEVIVRRNDVGRSQGARRGGRGAAWADHGAAVRSSVDHRRRRDGRPRDPRAVSARDDDLRADGRRRSDLRRERRGQGHARRRSSRRRRAGGRGADVGARWPRSIRSRSSARRASPTACSRCVPAT